MLTAKNPIVALAVAVLLLIAQAGLAQRNRRKATEEPKSQVLPLPPELPTAIQAETQTLDFHISPLLRTGGLGAQIRQSLTDLIRETKGETIVKLRAFVSGAGDARRVQAEVAEIFTERKLPLPVLSILQVGSLGEDTAAVVIEAVVATRRIANRGGIAFLNGQVSDDLSGALNLLRNSARAAQVNPDNVLTCTCFASQIEDYSAMRSSIAAVFPKSEVSLVQPLRASPRNRTMCEAVAQLNKAPETDLVSLANSRAVLVNAKHLVFTGLQLSFGSFLDDAHEAMLRLQRAAAAPAQNSPEQAVRVDAFSLDASGGSAIRKSTTFPATTFTVETVEGLPAIDATVGIEAVLAANATKAVVEPE